VFKLTKKAVGDQSETTARNYLERQGLSYITSNFRCRQGEIDLIMNDQHHLIFIEVRYRSRDNYGTAADTITHKKQRRIILAARYYLHKYQLTEKVSCRFDIVAIQARAKTCNTSTFANKNNGIKWIKDAFNTDG
jgi:putative endonuclease